MQAFHSFWTKPSRGRNRGALTIPDYELLTMVLSALEWQKWNGPIKMITDSDGADLLERLGLAGLWSEPLDTGLDGMDGAIDPLLFWAAGKLYALGSMHCPCVMLDTDMIFWKNIGDRMAGDVVAAHREELMPSVYPAPAETFRLAEGYAFPEEWDFGTPAANTAFLYMPDAAFASYYTESAFAFMRALRPGDYDPTVTMCFAEQRLLPVCAKARGVGVRYLLDHRDPDAQDFVTHLWGHKRALAGSDGQRAAYCAVCMRRIAADFPAWAEALSRDERLNTYLAR